jgi:hypothetical protein
LKKLQKPEEIFNKQLRQKQQMNRKLIAAKEAACSKKKDAENSS